jgi:hypothetical protein
MSMLGALRGSLDTAFESDSHQVKLDTIRITALLSEERLIVGLRRYSSSYLLVFFRSS